MDEVAAKKADREEEAATMYGSVRIRKIYAQAVHQK